MNSTVVKRVFFGSLLIAIVLVVVLLDGWLGSTVLPRKARGIGCGLILFILAGAGCLELSRLSRAKGFNPSLPAMILSVGLVLMQPYWSGSGQSRAIWLGLSLIMGLMLAGVFQAVRRGTAETLTNLALTSLAMIYLGVGCWFVLAIRLLGRESNSLWGQVGVLLLFLACVKCADIGAYFTGRKWGCHKWVPSISPGKTWEGFFGGVVVSIIVASLFSVFSGIINIGAAVIFAIVVAVVGQLGDLLESMLKRDTGIKDSARLVPEFGGVLDLLDSVLIAAPVAYIVLCKLLS